ncbi:uncharacterized protein BYT42DRAFT_574286 [Radiomyces spectabilis]|uniref:uncharacterized protein n=1 Tax=Radiomyces spectabilis TaxID=64574 RepID=UPI0022207830|nr:uncharacterized protein BYT42DRAFT_574286 [Radiomyces spectabilis]KAI8376349.1 hypothetical protein BYT42DRAFT_574286 [Radiomyces spectabilis]
MSQSIKRRVSSDDEVNGTSSSAGHSSPSNSSQRKRAKVSPAQDNEETSDDNVSVSEELEVQQDAEHTRTQVDISSTLDVAEAGTIARVEVVNFMCHKYLKVDLGPKINFVIGHNGSGKSAILTAITIALGAKANSTNRAKNLGALIREGANAAQVVVKITNKGADAYRHDIYGDYIQVERKLHKDGTGGYKIKDDKGRIVSTKREELTAICDFMSIQVDNPLTVLSQDNARQFLNSSTPQDKYKLFMRGTQLAQLAEDYDAVRESIDITRTILERKKQFLPDLQKKAKEAEIRFKEMLETREIDTKIDELNNELVWAQIIRKEKDATAVKADVGLAEKQLEETKARLDRSKLKTAKFVEEIQNMTEKVDGFRRSNVPDQTEKRKLTEEKLAKEESLRGLASDIRQINSYVKDAKARIQKYDSNIAAENAKLASINRDKMEKINAKIKELTEMKHQKVSQQQEYNQKQKDLNGEHDRLDNKSKELTMKTRNLKSQMDDIRSTLRNLRAQKENKLKAFGLNMPDVLSDIEAETRWRMRKPVGPFGRYLHLSHPQYADVLEVVLGKQLNSFAVECFQDKALLMQILQRRNMARIPIVVAKYDLFDYSQGEPLPEFLTILRALRFEDEWVKRQMIISSNIEQVILMEDRAEADRLMYQRPANVKGCFTKHGHSIGAKQGMRTDTINKYRGPPRFKKDIEPEIREAEQNMQQLLGTERRLQDELRQCASELTRVRSQLNEAKSAVAKLSSDIRRIDNEIERYQEMIKEDEPVNIAAIEEEKAECEKKIKALVGQFTGLKSSEREIHESLIGITERLAEIEGEEEARDQEIRTMRENIQKIEALRSNELQNVNKLQEKYDARVIRLESLRNEARQLERTCQAWIEQAMAEYPDRVDTNRRAEEIQRKIQHLEVIRTEKEKAVGASLEEVEQEAKDALIAWDDAKTSIEQMEGLIKNMKVMLEERMARWDVFKMYMSLSAMGHFSYYMHKRGDTGQLKFNHAKERLEVRVATGDQFRKGTRQKDSKSLSGGEKSFSQVSLLLSLWQSISSPILCLDEFDVYMDAVNRKQSMKMMMDSAHENSSQYILITPQDASNMKPGPYVTIHRLADPERHAE